MQKMRGLFNSSVPSAEIIVLINNRFHEHGPQSRGASWCPSPISGAHLSLHTSHGSGSPPRRHATKLGMST